MPTKQWTKESPPSILAATPGGTERERNLMVDGLQPRPVPPDPSSDRLDAWKEIAAYLKKDVRTVQRWEKNFGLPVRRMASGTVFAYRSEIDKWWKESES